ncbi:ArnT family glycosyltransferase [Polymorphum gilvum]|uniref:ArnT family glycosyltransferase n=1 Tax=Polymorphum gilvum TaxID=991904 RepID=UPI000A01281F|nr:glycosyltransferase family 39 protein [Polymorphum gilvum]
MTEPIRPADTASHLDAPRSGPPPFWLRLAGHDVTASLVLLVLALALFVPGQWSVPPLDRDEPRFTQATKQMLESGDYVDIRFQDEARHKKPVGIYWLQAATAKASGFGAEAPLWVYRLPSLVAAVLVVLLAYWTARAFTGPPAALVAALFVALSIILGVEARLAKTDATLFASILAAQGALARFWMADSRRPRWGLAFVFWTALAAGILVKGPVAPMVVGLTVLALFAFRRRFAWMKASVPLVGAPWMLLLVMPWFVAIWIATDGTFFREAVGQDMLGKVATGQESHGAPPLTHLAVMFAVFWPLPAFAVLAAPRIWAGRTTGLVQFCAAWFLPSWVVFELVATKLPHYTMPLLPALALATAMAVLDGARSAPRALRLLAAVLLALPAVGLAAATLAGPVALGVWPSPPAAVLGVLAAVLGVWGAERLARGEVLAAVPRAAGAGILIAVAVWAFAGPALTPIWVSPRLVTAVETVAPCAEPEVASTGFNEPSFVFLQGTGTRLIGPEAAAAFLAEAEGACRVAIVESRQEQAFLAAAQGLGLVPVAADRVDGLNINGGRRLDLGLYLAGTGAQ